MYVVVRVDDGKMVNQPGSEQSYTRSLSSARIFSSREEAQRECCGNEVVAVVQNIGGQLRVVRGGP